MTDVLIVVGLMGVEQLEREKKRTPPGSTRRDVKTDREVSSCSVMYGTGESSI